ncbi:MAG: PTS glucose transporter subunit IIA, partial [Mycoplasmataceae bacterium]|nr:PTS glucose transporter subunit IIA [Mycoplasmataceae bacterium]
MGFFSKLFGRKNKSIEIFAPVDGEIVSMTEVKDETFSKDMIGRGFAVKPTNGNFVSPIEGEITLIAETGHAYSVKTSNGVEILVHVGIDTVNMNSKDAKATSTPSKLVGFQIVAKTGDSVKVGSPILNADLAEIKKAGYDTITPVIVVNTEHTVNKTINTIVTGGNVT